jgi:hypothetical protein
MAKDLKKKYYVILLPSLLGFLSICWFKSYGIFKIGPIRFTEIWGPSILIGSVVFAVALPIFYRAYYAHNRRYDKSTSELELIKFERNLIYIALVPPYLALAAFFLELPSFYTAGTILMGMYGVYYFYPSKKRLALDRRIFKVR